VTRTDFDVDAFLAQALTARVATNGPTVRPKSCPFMYQGDDEARPISRSGRSALGCPLPSVPARSCQPAWDSLVSRPPRIFGGYRSQLCRHDGRAERMRNAADCRLRRGEGAP
jgi:hypothetical protein